MQLLNEYFEQLQAIRQGQQSLDAYLFAPVTTADGGQYDAHEAKRYRLLLALQCDRAADDKALLEPLLQAEIERHRMEAFQGLYPTLELACSLLARYQDTRHLPLFINAKRANFDTHCGLDVEYLASAGIAQSYAAAALLDGELREAFCDYLGTKPEQCKISEQDLEQWRARQKRRYPEEIVFRNLGAEIEFLLELGERERAQAKINEWHSSSFEPTAEGWSQWLSWQRSLNCLGGMIEAQQALLALETQDWNKGSWLKELVGLHLQNGDLTQALSCTEALQSLKHHFKDWRGLGMGRFIAEHYLDFVLAAKESHPDAAAQVYAWAKSLTMGMKNMHWNLLEKLVAVHEQFDDRKLAQKYRVVLRRERANAGF